MNKQNAIRHALSKLYKYKSSHNKDLYKVCINAFNSIPVKHFTSIEYCYGCVQDDFGYCYMRKDPMPVDEVFDKWCCDSMIKSLEKLLITEQSKKRR